MTYEKKQRFPMKRATRSFQRIGGGSPVYKGKRPGLSEVVREAEERAPELAARLEPGELKFLGQYYQHGTLGAAMKAMRPRLSDHSAYCRGSLLFKRIREKLSDAELFELMGVSFASISKVVTDALGATYVKDFVNRDGTIVSTEPRPDHTVRLQASQLAAKLRRLTDENEDQQISVNLIMYNKPGDPKWPSYEDNIVDTESIPCEGGKED